MKARAVPYQLGGGGDAHTGIYDNVSTRALQSVSLGENAGKISTGTGNAFVGYDAGKQNTDGTFNTMVGYQAGATSTNCTSGTIVGAFAGAQLQRGAEVTFVGYQAGQLSQDGNQLVGVGAYALRENTNGNGTVAVGYRAAERTLDGYYNTLIGTECGQDNRSGNFNTMAGYRSGRAAFLGNENTYFGAFAGYSNGIGDGNCFMGYKSGENLVDGSFNVALGAGSMQNAVGGSCNVAIGPFAGASAPGGEGSANVMIGAEVGLHAAPSRSVLVGASAGPNLTGTDSVLIGYSAGASVTQGSSNILIGVGADTYTPTSSNSIAIGSEQSISTGNSISIGNQVLNKGQYSVMVGHDLSSDTNNSIIVGNTNVIESVVLFKDPISEPLKNTVLADGATKVGLASIDYSQTTAPRSNQTFPYAFAAIASSNIINSKTNPPSNGTSPTSFDLRTAVQSHLILNPSAFALLQPDLDTASGMDADAMVLSASTFQTPLTVAPQRIEKSNILFLDAGCNFTWTGSSETFTANITQLDVNQTAIVVHSLLRGRAPERQISNVSYTICNVTPVHIVPSQVTQSIGSDAQVAFRENTAGFYGIDRGDVAYVVETPPMYGELDQGIFTSNQVVSIMPWIEHALSSNDSFVLRPVVQFQTDDNKLYGIASSNTIAINVSYQQETPVVFAADSIHLGSNLYPGQTHTLTSEIQPWPPTIDYLRFKTIDPRLAIKTHSGTRYNLDDLQTMEQEDVYSYPPGQFSTFVEPVPTTLAILSACNTELARNLDPLLDAAQSNISIIVLALQQGVPSEQLAVAQGAFAALRSSYLSYSEASLAFFQQASTNLNGWIQAYDPLLQIYSPFSRQAFDKQQEFYDAYFSTGLYSAWADTSTLYNVFASLSNMYEPSSNVLLDYTSNFNSVTLSKYTGFASYSNLAASVYPTFSNVYRKYNSVPRLFVTHDDVVRGGTSLEVISTPQTALAPLGVEVQGIACNVQLMYGTSLFWDTPTSNLPPQSFDSRPTQIQMPALATDAWYVAKAPTDGIINNNSAFNTFDNLSDATYIPFNAWSTSDDFEVAVFKPTSSLARLLKFNIAYDFSVRTCPLSVFATRHTETTQTSPAYLYSETSQQFFASNTTIIDQTSNGVSVPRITLQSLNHPYNPTTGYFASYCNIALCNVVTVYPDQNIGRITEHFYTRIVSDAYDGFTNTLSNIYTRDYEENPQVVSTTVLNSSEASNIYTWHDMYVCTSNLPAITSNVSITDLSRVNTFHSNTLPPMQLMYFESTLRNVPALTNVSIQQASTSNLFHQTLRYESRCNIHMYDGYVPVTRTQLSSATSNEHTYSISNLNPVQIVKEGAGPTQDVSFVSRERESSPVYWATVDHTQQLSQTNNAYTIPAVVGGDRSWEVYVRPLPTQIDSQALSIQVSVSLSSATNSADFSPVAVKLVEVTGFSLSDTLAVLKFGHGVIKDSAGQICTRCPLAAATTYTLCSQAPDDVLLVRLTNPSTGHTSGQVTIHLTFRQAPRPLGQSWNLGLQRRNKTTLDPTVFYHSWDNIAASSLQIDVVDKPSDMTIFYKSSPTTDITTFTQQDVLDKAIGVTFSGPCSGDLLYILKDMTVTSNQVLYQTLEPTRAFPVAAYRMNEFWAPTELLGAHIEWLQVGRSPSSNLLYGHWWNDVKSLHIQNAPIPAQSVRLYLTKPLQHGFLWNSNQPLKQTHTVTLAELSSNLVQYIQFTAGQALSNEAASWIIEVAGVNEVTPIYSIPWKNYVSRRGPVAINVGAASTEARSNAYPLISHGLTQDGFLWTTGSHVLPQQNTDINRVDTVWTLQSPERLNYWTGVIPVDRFVAAQHYQDGTGSVKYITVDQADSAFIPNFDADLSADEFYTIDHLVYLTQPPAHGIIQRISDGSPVTRWTQGEAAQRQIVYQHIGEDVLTDTFHVSVATSPYTASYPPTTFEVSVRPSPKVTTNKTSFVFTSSSNDAVTTKFPLAQLQCDGAGYLHLLGSNHISRISSLLDSSNAPISTINTQLLAQCAATLSESILNSSNNHPTLYPEASITFTVNRYSTQHVNRLAYIDRYTPYFLYTYRLQLNQHIDSNVITADLLPVQAIRYEIATDQTVTSNLAGRTVSVSFQVQPRPSYFDAQTQPHQKLMFHIDPLLQFEVTDTAWSLTTQSGGAFSSSLLPNALTPYEWNTIRIVNYDPENNNNLSVYINNDINVLKSAGFQVASITNLNESRAFEIRTPIYDSSNLLTSLNAITPVGDGTVSASFDFLNRYTGYYYRNFEITFTTYNAGSEIAYDPDTHNLVVGKSIVVRGINNICIGNQFITSGQRSIIVGNNIGSLIEGSNVSSGGVVNDVYQSIIMGNDSFVNSIVRDVICIGNQNLNDLANVDDVQQVQRFVSFKPIIIGNNIDASMLDHHINVGNTFLRTAVGGDQIYIGMKQDATSGLVVAVGYSSNERLGGSKYDGISLSVANGIHATDISVDKYYVHAVPVYGESIYVGMVVSEAPITSDADAYNIRVLPSRFLGDPLVLGVVTQVFDDATVKIQTCGRCRLWCDSDVNPGDLLVSSGHRGIATSLGTSAQDPNRLAFARALCSWRSSDVAATPWITSRVENGVTQGLLWCALITR